MIMKYEIYVKESRSSVVNIEADCLDDAIEIASERYSNGEIEFDEYEGVDISQW